MFFVARCAVARTPTTYQGQATQVALGCVTSQRLKNKTVKVDMGLEFAIFIRVIFKVMHWHQVAITKSHFETSLIY